MAKCESRNRSADGTEETVHDMGVTEDLASFIVETEYEAFSSAAIHEAKRAIRDYVGVALYGSQHEIGTKINRYVSRMVNGTGATLIGHGVCSPSGAALANGTFGHAIDYDDTFESIVLHPTSPIFPATLAMTELLEHNGEELLTGYLIGTEVAYRIGHATYPSHYEHGWHNTGTIGSFGATAAAASVAGLSVTETTHAFGIVGSGSSALKKNFGSMTKPLHAGHAAQIGLRSVLLAEDGFTADSAILDEKLGYGEVMTPDGSFAAESVTDDLGDSWGIMDNGFKPYPSGVITHAAMEALREVLVEEGLTEADVTSVTVTLDDAASEMLHHRSPENALEAKFSIEFCLAAVLREIDVGIQEFSDAYVTAADTREVIPKIHRAFEPNLFGEEYAGYGARIIVETESGEEFERSMRRAPGSQSNPIPDERWEQKFIECAGTVLPDETIEALHDAIFVLEEPGTLEQFVSILKNNQ